MSISTSHGAVSYQDAVIPFFFKDEGKEVIVRITGTATYETVLKQLAYKITGLTYPELTGLSITIGSEKITEESMASATKKAVKLFGSVRNQMIHNQYALQVNHR